MVVTGRLCRHFYSLQSSPGVIVTVVTGRRDRPDRDDDIFTPLHNTFKFVLFTVQSRYRDLESCYAIMAAISRLDYE